MEKDKQGSQPFSYEEDEIDLYELWLTLKKRKKIVLAITGFFTIAALILCFILSPVYKTETSLMPLGGKKGGFSSLLARLPVSVPTSTGQSGITVEAVLKSRTLRKRLIQDLNLLPIFFSDKWDKKNKRWILEGKDDKPPTIFDGAKKLDKLISVSTDEKTGVITLSVNSKNPELAYKIAKTALKEARTILNEKSFTLAKKYRLYVGKQLTIAREKIFKIDNIYENFMKGKIKKVPLIFGENALKYNKKIDANVTPAEIEKLKEKMGKLSKNIKRLRVRSNFVSLPEYKLNLEKLQLQISVAQGLFGTLVKEYEMAKAQEMKEQISFQIIDPPYIPEKPYKPKKKLIVVVGFVTGLILGVFVAFFKEWIYSMKDRHLEEEKESA